ILAGPSAPFFQARKPHRVPPPPHGTKRSFADPSSRIHNPAASPAFAADTAAVSAKATNNARVIVYSFVNLLLGGRPIRPQASAGQRVGLRLSGQSGLYPPLRAATVEGGVKTSATAFESSGDGAR